jgi:hypothetical protein
MDARALGPERLRDAVADAATTNTCLPLKSSSFIARNPPSRGLTSLGIGASLVNLTTSSSASIRWPISNSLADRLPG